MTEQDEKSMAKQKIKRYDFEYQNCDYENNLAVSDPLIVEVIDTRSGTILSAKEVIGSDYQNLIKLRSDLGSYIKNGEPRYVCSLCHTPVRIVCNGISRLFFFRHELDDGRCTIDTRGNLSEDEINARKYNGVKESEAHKRIKSIVEKSIKIDERFGDPKVEKVWKGKESGKWRKPDVSAIFDDKTRFAFEIQLSTTFLRVILERKAFYLKEGGFLCWIFKDIEEEYPRLMQDDIFVNNNSNMFVASEETLSISNKEKQFFLECHWLEPAIDNQEIVDKWEQKIVPISECTFDQEHQRIFFFDYEHEKQKLTQQFDRERFEEFWLNNASITKITENWQGWLAMESILSKHDILLPKKYHLPNPHLSGLMPLLNILYSVKHGIPIGYNYEKLIQIAHLTEDKYKKYLRVFGRALILNERGEQIKREDCSGKWAKKVEKFKPLMQSHDKTYRHDNSFNKLIFFLFPEFNKLKTRGFQ